MAEKEWTEELKAKVVKAYQDAEPTVDNTLDIVKNIANEIGKTSNGVRIILSKAGVYVKKTVASVSTDTKSTRVNKADAIETLKKTIEDAGKEVDDDICDRLTGKAAVYFTKIIA
jgi:hypothetical protein